MRRKQDSLHVLQWNAGGLTQTKRTELVKILNDKKVDVFTIMEANRLKKDMARFAFPGYNVFLLEKGRKVASGILVGVKNTITSSFEIIKSMGESDDKIEIVLLNCWRNNCHFKIYSVYNPPNNKPNLDLINVNRRTIVIGDFNAHSQKWGYNDRNLAGDAVEDFLCSNNLELVFDKQDKPTFLHYSGASSNPDLLMVSTDIIDATQRTVVEDCGSGHRMVLANIDLPLNRASRPCNRVSWNFRKADWPAFRDFLENGLDESKIDFNQHPEKIAACVNSIIINAAKKFIPRGRQKVFSCFWSDNLTKLKEERDDLRNKAQETQDPQVVIDWRRSNATLKREINRAKRAAFGEFISKVNYKTEALKTYKFMNRLCSKNCKMIKEPMKLNNKFLCDDKQISNAFVKFFVSRQRKSGYMKWRDKLAKRYVLDKTVDDSAEDLCNRVFTEFELELAISQMKVGSSPGPDLIFAEFILHTGERARKTLLRLFNKIWNATDAIPSLWKKATIIPLLKKDKPASDFNSYRPISLTCILAKLMERLVINRLKWHLETRQLLHHAQGGFRKNRSTEELVTTFSQSIKDNLDKSNIVGAIFVDFKGAYDTVWKTRLLHKLATKHISGNMLRWFKDFLDQRLINIRYGTAHSSFRTLQTGLPQGAVSSCLLFDVYVDDLIQSLIDENIGVLMYADDLVLWTSSSKSRANERLETSLNNAMSRLHTWCLQNNMTVNIEKTTYQTFSLCHQPLKLQLFYNNSALPCSESTKYLGVTFDRKLTWKLYIDDIKQRAEKRMILLKRLAGVRWGCATTTLLTTYKTFIKPVMTYCNAPLITVSEGGLERLERIQNNALRLITGAVKTTPIDAMLLYTNVIPMHYEIMKSALKLYQKLIRLPHSNMWKRSGPRRLKTQDGFLQAVLKEMDGLDIPSRIEPFPPPLNPLEASKIVYYLDLMNPVLKAQDCTAALFSAEMETIYNRFPPEAWLHIYTDGSKFEMNGMAGAGVYCEYFSHYLSLGTAKTAFDGEVESVKVALTHLNARPPLSDHAVIFSDSQAAILAIADCFQAPSSVSVMQCRSLMREMRKKYKRIALQWIPSHCGIPGNEKADELAKKGCSVNQVPYNLVNYKSASSMINQALKTRHMSSLKERTKEKLWRNDILNLPECPRSSAVAAFRLTTRHDCLCSHLSRFRIVNSPACPLCCSGAVMNADHLPVCSALTKNCIYSRYWEARDSLNLLTS